VERLAEFTYRTFRSEQLPALVDQSPELVPRLIRSAAGLQKTSNYGKVEPGGCDRDLKICQ